MALTSTASASSWNLEMLVFVEGGKILRARTKTDNKLKPHMASPRDSNPSYVGGEASALTTTTPPPPPAPVSETT